MNLTLKGQVVAIFTLLCYLFAFGIAAYEVSYRKGKIYERKFTVSQSLDFGNDYALVTLFTLGFISYIYLITLKGPNKFLNARILCQVIVYIFLITIIWITTYKDKEKHYIFAFIIFLTIFIYHVLTYLAFKGTKKSELMMNLLLIACILNFLVFIGLGVTNLKSISDKTNDRIVFASLENTCTLITGAVIFIIGFMA